MRLIYRTLLPLMLLATSASAILAQGVPTSQPSILSIFVEELKVGMDSDHEANEVGWPAAYARASNPNYYLAMSSMTGPAEVWFIASFDSYAAEGEAMKMVSDNPDLAAELNRLWRADGQYLSGTRSIQAIARPDLSYGEFPDIGLARFWDISTVRIRLGHEQAWEQAAAVYKEIVSQAAPGMSYRVYQVVNGMQGSNYLIFSSVNAYADFDKMMADGQAAFASATPAQMTTLQNFMTNDVQNVGSNRYSLSASMSYVDAETKAKDPAFWNKR